MHAACFGPGLGELVRSPWVSFIVKTVRLSFWAQAGMLTWVAGGGDLFSVRDWQERKVCSRKE